MWFTGSTAAALHGFDGYVLRPPYRMAIPRGRSLYRVGHVTTRLRDIEPIDCTWRYDLPLLSPTRTLVEIAAVDEPHVVTAALDSALRDGGTSEDFLHRRLTQLQRPGRAGPNQLLAVLAGAEASRGGHSWLERSFLEGCAARHLPRPHTQQVVGRRDRTAIRVDCRFPGTPVVVELLGYRFHRTPMQIQRDAERMNVMVLDGFAPLQFTYRDVVERLDATLDLVEAALSGFAQKSTSSSGRTQTSR
jgi:very-short-patch-repair endonuclease